MKIAQRSAPGARARRRSIALAAVIGLMAAALAACSSSGGGSSASGPSNSTSSGGNPIVIGNVGSYTGGPGDLSGGTKALQAWASSVNAAGGINGRPVNLIIKDTGGSVSGGLLAVKELIQQEHAVAIVGEDDQSDANWASYAEQSGVPVIGGNPIESVFMSNPDFYPAGGNIVGLLYGVAKQAAARNGKIAVVYCAEAPLCKQVPALMTGIAAAAGSKLVASVAASATAVSYTAVCQTIKDSGAGVYYLAVSGTLALRLTALCKQAGVTAAPAIIGGSADTAQATSANNGLLEVDNNYPFYDSSIAASKAFQTAVAKYQPLKGAEYGSIAMWSWASAELFQKAATLAGKDITPASLKSALYSLKAETLGGISPPLTFTKDKPAFIACYFVYSVSGGKWTTSDGGKSACAPPALAKALAK